MKTANYVKYTEQQLSKIGNTAIYLSERIERLSKTKFLKLLYILDELSVSTSGIPFFNLQYKVWKLGPVAEPIFVDLSSEITLLAPYIGKDREGHLFPKKTFDDDEFSDNDLDLLEKVIDQFGRDTAKDLVAYTHRENSLWDKKAREENVLDDLENKRIANTDFLISLEDLVVNDPRKKAIYRQYVEQF